MTPPTPDLGRRAVACKGWRWMRGMLRHDDYRYIGSGLWARWSHTAAALTAMHAPEQYPDLSDPATLGCMLALVREAWGDPHAYLAPGDGWCVGRGARDGIYGEGVTEAEALVAALEAALVAGGAR